MAKLPSASDRHHATHRLRRHAQRQRRDGREQRQRQPREQPVRAGLREQHPCQRLPRQRELLERPIYRVVAEQELERQQRG